MDVRRAPTAWLAIAGMALVGCQCTRHDEASALFMTNRGGFQRVADTWLDQSRIGELYRFSKDEFRCNGSFMTAKSGAEQIASSCGVPNSELQALLHDLDRLQIYGVTLEAMGNLKWVEISLAGSGWDPWGFRYVRPPSTKGIDYFRKLSADGGFHRDACFREIGSGWFYFESER